MLQFSSNRLMKAFEMEFMLGKFTHMYTKFLGIYFLKKERPPT